MNEKKELERQKMQEKTREEKEIMQLTNAIKQHEHALKLAEKLKLVKQQEIHKNKIKFLQKLICIYKQKYLEATDYYNEEYLVQLEQYENELNEKALTAIIEAKKIFNNAKIDYEFYIDTYARSLTIIAKVTCANNVTYLVVY